MTFRGIRKWYEQLPTPSWTARVARHLLEKLLDAREANRKLRQDVARKNRQLEELAPMPPIPHPHYKSLMRVQNSPKTADKPVDRFPSRP